MIGVIATLKVKSDKKEKFEEVFGSLSDNVSKHEQGCHCYRLFKSETDADTYVVIEQYENQAAVDAHMASDYFTAAHDPLKDCLADAPKLEFLQAVS